MHVMHIHFGYIAFDAMIVFHTMYLKVNNLLRILCYDIISFKTISECECYVITIFSIINHSHHWRSLIPKSTKIFQENK